MGMLLFLPIHSHEFPDRLYSISGDKYTVELIGYEEIFSVSALEMVPVTVVSLTHKEEDSKRIGYLFKRSDCVDEDTKTFYCHWAAGKLILEDSNRFFFLQAGRESKSLENSQSDDDTDEYGDYDDDGPLFSNPSDWASLDGDVD